MGQLIKPEWVQAWEKRSHSEPDATTVYAAIDSVRSGSTLEETEALTGLSRTVLFKIVGQVGSRCTQISKHHTKATKVIAGPAGAPPLITPQPDGNVIVTAAGGWVRSRREGDIRKAYAATLIAEESVCALAVSRVTAASLDEMPVRYVHFADLHAASRGVLPPLDKVVVAGPASDAYLRAWQLIDDAVVSATAGVHVLLNRPTPQAAQAALQQSWWLVPQATVAHRWTNVCLNPPNAHARIHAEQRLRAQLMTLGAYAHRMPHKLRPTRLEHISATQMRAIAARFGHHPGDGLSARSETAFESFATMAAEAMRAMQLEDAKTKALAHA